MFPTYYSVTICVWYGFPQKSTETMKCSLASNHKCKKKAVKFRIIYICLVVVYKLIKYTVYSTRVWTCAAVVVDSADM